MMTIKKKFDSLFTDRNSGIILLATELSENDLLPFLKDMLSISCSGRMV